MARLGFALQMIRARWDSNRGRCPYCSSRIHQLLQRKRLIVQARKCQFCGLIFRWPTEDPETAQTFYETNYEGQQATDLPSSETALADLVAARFRGTPFDKSYRLPALRRNADCGRVLDFGCSWGYSLVQWTAAGYDVVGFEFARDRARFGREKLSLQIHERLADLAGEREQSFDLVYADHVMEHLPRLSEPIDLFARLLRPGGTLLIFVPNGGGFLARQHGTRWLALIGEAHTVAFTSEWFLRNLPQHGFAVRCYSTGDDPDLPWSPRCDGEELVCEAKRLPTDRCLVGKNSRVAETLLAKVD